MTELFEILGSVLEVTSSSIAVYKNSSVSASERSDAARLEGDQPRQGSERALSEQDLRAIPPPAVEPDPLEAARQLCTAGQYEEALRACSKAIALDPVSAAAYALRGKMKQALGRADEAATDLRVAVHLDPQMESARQALQELTGEAAPPEAGLPAE